MGYDLWESPRRFKFIHTEKIKIINLQPEILK